MTAAAATGSATPAPTRTAPPPAAACRSSRNAAGTPLASATPPAGAYGPAQFHTAYNLPTRPRPRRHADDRDRRRLRRPERSSPTSPPTTPTTACPRARPRTAASGRSTRPAARATRPDTSWHLEIALDVETAHAICQNCKILLVEATLELVREPRRGGERGRRARARTSSRTPTAAASTRARPPTRPPTSSIPGVAITASSGDSGYGVEFPAASQYVTAVGGTTLQPQRGQHLEERDGLERRRLGLLGLRAEAVLADRLRLLAAHGRRRLGRRRPEHRRRGLRLGRRLRRQPRGTRSAARASPRRSSAPSTRSPATRASTTARRRTRTPRRSTTSRPGSNGSCSARVPLQRRDRLRRPDRARLAERDRRRSSGSSTAAERVALDLAVERDRQRRAARRPTRSPSRGQNGFSGDVALSASGLPVRRERDVQPDLDLARPRC